MANEISLSLSLTGYKPSVMIQAIAKAIIGAQFNMAGNFYIAGQMTATTGGAVVPLGTVTQPHWSFWYNTDTVNFVRLANGSGGAKFVKMKALEPAAVPLDDLGVPYAFADTASVELEYLIFSL